MTTLQGVGITSDIVVDKSKEDKNEGSELLYNSLLAYFQRDTSLKNSEAAYNLLVKVTQKDFTSISDNALKERLSLMLGYLEKCTNELPAQGGHDQFITYSKAYSSKLLEEITSEDATKTPVTRAALVTAIALTFTLAVEAKSLIPANTTERNLRKKNAAVGSCLAHQLLNCDQQVTGSTKFNRWRFAAGLALFLFGTGLAIAAGCSIGVSFGATAPFAVMLAKFSLEIAALGAGYLLFAGCAALMRRNAAAGERTGAPAGVALVVGVAAGVSTGLAGALPASFTLSAGATTLTASGSAIGVTTLFSSLTVAAAAGLAACASGGYLMWTSLAKRTIHRPYEKSSLEAKKAFSGPKSR